MRTARTVGGRYVVEGELGAGGMGQVYRVRHAQLGKVFALKIISPAFAGDTAARERFNEEAKLASEISHPNIVSVVDYGEDPELGAYMVMELVDGEPLCSSETGWPISIKRAIDVLAQVADALDHIHKRAIIHGDVKADNILLVAEAAGTTGTRRRRMVRLLDFGLARRHGAHEDSVSGSPHYFAPERCMGGPATVLTDVYALGVLGYLLFAGSLPFDGDLMEILTGHVERAPDPLAQRRAEPIDEAINVLIQRAMAKDPSARTASAAAFRYELNTVMDMLGLGRRRRSSGAMKVDNARDASLALLFDRSKLPQAVVASDGRIAMANRAFAKLVGQSDESLDGVALDDTALATSVPGLMRAVRTAHVEGKAIEHRAQVCSNDQPVLELVLWLTPASFGEHDVHLIVRVVEIGSQY